MTASVAVSDIWPLLRLSKIVRFCGPSSVAVVLATIATGLIEGALYRSTPYATVAGVGYVAVFAVPTAFAAALVVRGLVSAWRVGPFLAATADADGSSPRLAAAVVVSSLSVAAVVAVAFTGLTILGGKTQVASVVALGGALLVGATVVVVLLLSRPAYLVSTAIFRSLEESRNIRPFLTPARIGLAAFALCAIASAVAWFGFLRPRIGHLDLRPIYLALAFAFLVAAVHVAWPRASSRQRWITTAVVLGALVVCAATAAHARGTDTDAVLAIWGDRPIAGKAVDSLFDTANLVESRNLQAIAPRATAQSHPDILLVTIDTLRADRTPPYGGGAHMPTLAKLADKGTVFEWAFASGNVTRRALATIATGLSPHRAKGRLTGWALKLDPRHVVFAERLRAGGYETAGFFWSKKFFGPSRFGRGIEHLEFAADGAQDLAKRARAWMRKRSAKKGESAAPLFTWVHFLEPHGWKDFKGKPPKGLDSQARKLWRYDSTLRVVDSALATLLDNRTPVRNPAGRIVIVTADHGEGLGDHGAPYHSTDLYNSQIRVPLIVAGANVVQRRIEHVAGHADLAATILELAGFRPLAMPESDGASLASLIRGTQADDPTAGVAHSSMVADRSVPVRSDAIVVGRYKYIEGEGSAELYDLHQDPDEEKNINETQPKIAARLASELAKRRAREAVSPFVRPR